MNIEIKPNTGEWRKDFLARLIDQANADPENNYYGEYSGIKFYAKEALEYVGHLDDYIKVKEEQRSEELKTLREERKKEEIKNTEQVLETVAKMGENLSEDQIMLFLRLISNVNEKSIYENKKFIEFMENIAKKYQEISPIILIKPPKDEKDWSQWGRIEDGVYCVKEGINPEELLKTSDNVAKVMLGQMIYNFKNNEDFDRWFVTDFTNLYIDRYYEEQEGEKHGKVWARMYKASLNPKDLNNIFKEQEKSTRTQQIDEEDKKSDSDKLKILLDEMGIKENAVSVWTNIYFMFSLAEGLGRTDGTTTIDDIKEYAAKEGKRIQGISVTKYDSLKNLGEVRRVFVGEKISIENLISEIEEHDDSFDINKLKQIQAQCPGAEYVISRNEDNIIEDSRRLEENDLVVEDEEQLLRAYEDIKKEMQNIPLIMSQISKKISTQKIGQATINIPITDKKKVEQVENGKNTRDNIIKEGEEVGDGN